MNATVQGPFAGQEVVTQESLLLGTAERIGRIRQGRMALHLHLSKLRPHNRQESHVRIALRMFDPMVAQYRGQMFLLSNSDIVLLVKDARIADLDALVYKLRALFGKDPLTFADSGDGRDRFCSWYDLEYDYEAFFALCRRMAEDVRRRQPQKQAARQPIDPKGLAQVLARINAADIAPAVRRQAAIDITAKGNAEVLFQEFFVSMADLQKAVAPDINLLGNRWLFQHLSETLDQRMLRLLPELGLRALPNCISVNLNVSTLFTPAFKALEQSIKDRASLVVEVQIIDVFSDLGAYFFARDWLQGRGHKLLLDGLNGLTLQFMDIEQYGADFIKINWSPELSDAGHAADVADALADFGTSRAILARCDSEVAIQWGMGLDIFKFQGRYVDAMLSAVTMATCDKAAACSLQQCVHRRGVVTGPLRAECGNLAKLDNLPKVRAPRR